MKKSSDCCKTWSEPVRVSIVGGYNVINNSRVIRARNNRIIVPAACSKDISKGYAVGICYYSDDEGITWHSSRDEIILENSNTGV